MPPPFQQLYIAIKKGEPEEVSIEKCRLASLEVDGPVMAEDTSLCYNALGGLPGVYIKWFLEKTGHEGLNNLLASITTKCVLCNVSIDTSASHQTGRIQRQTCIRTVRLCKLLACAGCTHAGFL